MSAYTCNECDKPLEARVREVELKEGETAKVTESRVIISHVACSNGCDDEETPNKEKPKKRKTNARSGAVARESGDSCPKSELCDRSAGHTGRCNSKLAELVEA